MPAKGRGALSFCAAFMLAVTGAGHASERSQLLVTRGQAAYQARRFTDARDRFAEAVAGDPDDASAQYGLGLALGKLGRWQEARGPIEKALALRAGFSAARRALGLVSYHLGEAALERGEYEQAAALLDDAARLAPSEAGRARYLAGVARARRGQADEARKDSEAAARAPEREVAGAANDFLERPAPGRTAAPHEPRAV